MYERGTYMYADLYERATLQRGQGPKRAMKVRQTGTVLVLNHLTYNLGASCFQSELGEIKNRLETESDMSQIKYVVTKVPTYNIIIKRILSYDVRSP